MLLTGGSQASGVDDSGGGCILQAELLPRSEELAIREAFRARLARVSPLLGAEGNRLLARIAPDRWLLEWGLPLWLGETFGLTAETARALALGNVLGLAYVRVQDDLIDDELPSTTRASAMALATVAFQQAIVLYARLLADDERFWTALELRLGQWVQAMRVAPRLPRDFVFHPDSIQLRSLSETGAPVHIGLVATCLLGQRHDLLPRLTTVLDDWLVANVLMDHARDWAADLEAGRDNYFVAYATPLEQGLDQREVIRRRILEMTYLGDGGQAYFDLVLHHLASARAAARPVGCDRLDSYLEGFTAQVTVDLHAYREQAAGRLRAASQFLFGETVGPAAGHSLALAPG